MIPFARQSILFAIFAWLAAPLPSISSAQDVVLGEIEFPNSGAAEAQAGRAVLNRLGASSVARAFHGLSIPGVGSVDRGYATYMKAAAVITPVRDG